MDENGAIMTGSSRLQRRHFTSGTITYFAEAPLGTPLTSPGWRCWKLDTATGSDIEFAIGSTGLPSDSFEFIATDAILPLHNYGFVSDIVAPTLSTVTMASNNTVTTSAKIGDIATLTIVSNEEIRTPTVTIAGRSATVIAGVDALHWTATQTLISGDTEGLLALSVAFSDVG